MSRQHRQASDLSELAAGFGRTLGLLIDWASPTRMGRLRGAGLCGALASAFVWLADVQVLRGGPGVAGWAVAGTLAVPVLAAGYWHVGEALRTAVPRAAGLVRVVGLYAAAVGAALHAVAVATPQGAALVPLALATAGLLGAASLVFAWGIVAKPTDYPRALALFTPASLAAAIWLAGRLVPGWQESAAFAALPAAHLVFFLVSVVVIERHNPDSWR